MKRKPLPPTPEEIELVRVTWADCNEYRGRMRLAALIVLSALIGFLTSIAWLLFALL